MQTTGYVIDKTTNEKILILVRQASYYRLLKLRKSGKDGVHFSDEESFLNDQEEKQRFDELKKGVVISCYTDTMQETINRFLTSCLKKKKGSYGFSNTRECM